MNVGLLVSNVLMNWLLVVAAAGLAFALTGMAMIGDAGINKLRPGRKLHKKDPVRVQRTSRGIVITVVGILVMMASITAHFTRFV